MNKHSQEISYGPLEESEAMKALPEDVKESILALYPLLEENPEEVLQKTPEYLSKYPGIPMLYNFLYGAYRKAGRPREAMKLMKETVQLFPNYLFGRVEYALYLLRRGEPEKAHAALKNAGTLSQLYPERKIFHAAEWKAFAYAMGLYWIQKGDINQAEIYLAIIQKITPKSSQITVLQKKMKSKLFLQSMEKLQKELKPQMSNG
jgi:tetratricopeptide (TPR) repeat protein